jgi:hypothetical protein
LFVTVIRNVLKFPVVPTTARTTSDGPVLVRLRLQLAVGGEAVAEGEAVGDGAGGGVAEGGATGTGVPVGGTIGVFAVIGTGVPVPAGVPVAVTVPVAVAVLVGVLVLVGVVVLVAVAVLVGPAVPVAVGTGEDVVVGVVGQLLETVNGAAAAFVPSVALNVPCPCAAAAGSR